MLDIMIITSFPTRGQVPNMVLISFPFQTLEGWKLDPQTQPLDLSPNKLNLYEAACVSQRHSYTVGAVLTPNDGQQGPSPAHVHALPPRPTNSGSSSSGGVGDALLVQSNGAVDLGAVAGPSSQRSPSCFSTVMKVIRNVPSFLMRRIFSPFPTNLTCSN
jgi:hypothetical protein